MTKLPTPRYLLLLLFVMGSLATILPVGVARAQASVAGCHPRTERSVSIGVYRDGGLRTMSYCFTGGVTGSTLTVSGRSVDDTGDALCARAVTRYTTRTGGVTIPHPLNCSGGPQPVEFRPEENVEQVSLRVCAVDTGSGRVVACSGSNQVHPALDLAGSVGRR